MQTQKGVSLIILFLAMTVILAIVLAITTILFREIKIIRNTGESVSSFYAANTGVEKTLYFDRHQVPAGATHGLCNVCNVCTGAATDSGLHCSSCTTTPLAVGGCSPTTCNNCQLDYSSGFLDKTYTIFATITPNSSNSSLFDILIRSKGFYKSLMRQIELNVTE